MKTVIDALNRAFGELLVIALIPVALVVAFAARPDPAATSGPGASGPSMAEPEPAPSASGSSASVQRPRRDDRHTAASRRRQRTWHPPAALVSLDDEGALEPVEPPSRAEGAIVVDAEAAVRAEAERGGAADDEEDVEIDDMLVIDAEAAVEVSPGPESAIGLKPT